MYPSPHLESFYAVLLLLLSSAVAQSWLVDPGSALVHGAIREHYKYLVCNFLSHDKGMQYQDHCCHPRLISLGLLARREDRVKLSHLLARAALLKSIASTLPRIEDFTPLTKGGLLDVLELIRY